MAMSPLEYARALRASMDNIERQQSQQLEQQQAEADRNTSALQDLGTALKVGILRAPSAMTGLLDIPVAAVTGRAMVSEGWDGIGDLTGLDFDTWADEAAQREYSQGHQRGEQAFQQAEGFGDSAMALLRNLPYAASMGVESVPGMILGGRYAKALRSVPMLKGMSKLTSVGVGEGAVMAGQAMGDLVDDGVDPRIAALASTGIGLAGGTLGVAGGAASRRMGLTDLDMLMGGLGRGATDTAADTLKPGIKAALARTTGRVAGGVVSEGLFEEMPQSAMETIIGNVARGDEWDQDLGKNMAAGAVVGGMMGGTINLMPPARKNPPTTDTGDTTPDTEFELTPPEGTPDAPVPQFDLNTARSEYGLLARQVQELSQTNPEQAVQLLDRMSEIRKDAEANDLNPSLLSPEAAAKELGSIQKQVDKLSGQLNGDLLATDPDKAKKTMAELAKAKRTQGELEQFLNGDPATPQQAFDFDAEPEPTIVEPVDLIAEPEVTPQVQPDGAQAELDLDAPDPVPLLRVELSQLASQAQQLAESGDYEAAIQATERMGEIRAALEERGVKPSQMTEPEANKRLNTIATEIAKERGKNIDPLTSPEAAAKSWRRIATLEQEQASLSALVAEQWPQPAAPNAPVEPAAAPDTQGAFDFGDTAPLPLPVVDPAAPSPFTDVAALRKRVREVGAALPENAGRPDDRIATQLSKAATTGELLQAMEDLYESTGSARTTAVLDAMYQEITGYPIGENPAEQAAADTPAEAAAPATPDAAVPDVGAAPTMLAANAPMRAALDVPLSDVNIVEEADTAGLRHKPLVNTLKKAQTTSQAVAALVGAYDGASKVNKSAITSMIERLTGRPVDEVLQAYGAHRALGKRGGKAGAPQTAMLYDYIATAIANGQDILATDGQLMFSEIGKRFGLSRQAAEAARNSIVATLAEEMGTDPETIRGRLIERNRTNRKVEEYDDNAGLPPVRTAADAVGNEVDPADLVTGNMRVLDSLNSNTGGAAVPESQMPPLMRQLEDINDQLTHTERAIAAAEAAEAALTAQVTRMGEQVVTALRAHWDEIRQSGWLRGAELDSQALVDLYDVMTAVAKANVQLTPAEIQMEMETINEDFADGRRIKGSNAARIAELRQEHARLLASQKSTTLRLTGQTESGSDIPRLGQPTTTDVESEIAALEAAQKADIASTKTAEVSQTAAEADDLDVPTDALPPPLPPKGTAKIKVKKKRRIVRESFNQGDRIGNLDPTPEEAQLVAEGVAGKSVVEALEWIAENTQYEDQAIIAQQLAMRIQELESVGVVFEPVQVVGVGDRVPSALLNARGIASMGETSFMMLNGPGVTGKVGTSFETVLHEAAHLATMSAVRIGRLRAAQNTEVGQLISELNAVRNYVVRYFNSRVNNSNATWGSLTEFEQRTYARHNNAFANLDEFIAWALTNRDMQDYLRSIPMPKSKWQTMWDAIVNAVGRFLGIDAGSENALARTLSAIEGILNSDAMDLVDVGNEVGLSMQVEGVSQQVDTVGDNSNANRGDFNRLGSELFATVRPVADQFVRWVTNGLSFTSDLVQSAKELGLDSAERLEAASRRKATRVNELQLEVDEVVTRLGTLPQAVRTQTERLIYRMTVEGKWGFEPDWRDGAVVDPEMAEAFGRLPQEGQEALVEAFRYSDRIYRAKIAQLQRVVAGEYDALAAQTTDPTELRRIERERAAKLRESGEMIGQLQGPYAPLRRYGNYVVVAKSDAFRQAQANNESTRKMESDSNHYVVEFVQNQRQAEARARELEAQFGREGVWAGQKEEAGTHFSEASFDAVRQLRARFAEQFEGSEKAKRVIDKLLVDLYISTLTEQNARHAAQKRRRVAGASQDMTAAFATQGRADAHLLASMEYGDQIVQATTMLREESKQRREGDTHRDTIARTALRNELLKRQIMDLDYRDSPVQDKILAGNSFWMLVTSPSYYMQNAFQPWIMSLPVLAGKFGRFKAAKELLRGTQDASKTLAMSSWQEAANLDAFKGTAAEKRMLEELQNRGTLDFGISAELGYWENTGPVSKMINKVMRNSSMAVRKLEVINRMGTALAGFRMAMENANPALTPEEQYAAALKYADRVTVETHGDYSNANAPTAIRYLPRIMTQFRKFQVIQVSLFARQMHKALAGATKEERAVARATMINLFGTHALFAGAMGIPAAGLIWPLIMWATGGDDDDPREFEVVVRRALGDNKMADYLLYGAPTALGINFSGRIGAGQMLDPLPFADYGLDRNSYEKMLAAAAGPFLSGTLPQALDGINRMRQGEFAQGMAQLMPKGARDAIRAYEASNEGIKDRAGRTLLDPELLSFYDSVMMGIGAPTLTTTRPREVNALKRTYEDHFSSRSSQLKRDFVEAYKDNDAAKKRELERDWLELQAVRVNNGFARQPISDLRRAPFARKREEQKVIGGVRTTDAAAGFVEPLVR